MLNPLKWSLRALSDPCIPNGPNFEKAKPYHFLLSDTQVTIRLNRPTGVKFFERLYPYASYDIYLDDKFYREVDRETLPRLDILHFHWGYWGPAFVGEIADLSCVCAVIAPTDLPEGSNLFRPQDLEQHIERIIVREQGDPEDFFFGRARWMAPVKWQVIEAGDVYGISYEVNTIPGPGAERYQFLIIPITKDRYLKVCFRYYQELLGADLAESNRMISPKPMEALVENIIASLDIRLSPEAQQQKAEADAAHPNESLTSYVAPYKFTSAEHDAEWADYQQLMAQAAALKSA
jgi:hypothetical protein